MVRAIAGLMLFCGLRSAEILSLQVGDIDISARLLLVQGKGAKERRVPLDVDVAGVIQMYLLAERPKPQAVTLGQKRGRRLDPGREVLVPGSVGFPACALFCRRPAPGAAVLLNGVGGDARGGCYLADAAAGLECVSDCELQLVLRFSPQRERGHDPLYVWLRHDSPGLRRHARILFTGAVAVIATATVVSELNRSY
jgi:hypothetical protein